MTLIQVVRAKVGWYLDRFTLLGGVLFFVAMAVIWLLNRYVILREYEEVTTNWTTTCKINDGDDERRVYFTCINPKTGESFVQKETVDYQFLMDSARLQKPLAVQCSEREWSASGDQRIRCVVTVEK